MSLGVLVWIAAFDLGYAQMDIESDKKNGIKSFPSRFSPPVTFTAILVSIPIWAAAFSILSSLGVILSVIFVVGVLVAGGNDFQNWWFRSHAATGWILLISMQLS